MDKHNFRVFDGGECPKNIFGEEEHNLNVAGESGNRYEYCYRCGKAWNLTEEEAVNIWSIEEGE